MADSKSNKQPTDLFRSKVLPIMDKVQSDLNSKIHDELKEKQSSFAFLSAGAVGPDGGETAMAVQRSNLKNTGEWSSKTVEDYIAMVKKELKKQGIQVTPVIEKKMIDHLIKQEMPKSTAEYIMKKAAEGSIFGIEKRVQTSSLQDHINKEAEKRYNPSTTAELTGSLLGWGINVGTTMGAGGLWGQAAMDLVVAGANRGAQGQQSRYVTEQQKLAIKDVETAEKKVVTIPKWMLTNFGFDKFSSASDKQLTEAIKNVNANSAWYRNKVNEALNNGERTIQTGKSDQLMSLTDAVIRTKQYEQFSLAAQKELSSRVPKWMMTKNGFDSLNTATDAQLQKTLEFAQKNSQFYQSKVEAAVRSGATSIKINGKPDMSITNANIHAQQYITFASLIQKEQTDRVNARNVKQEETPSMNVPTTPAEEQHNTSEASIQEQPSTKPSNSAGGWSNLPAQMGLDGIGDTMGHLGFTLAKLPDMLIGMFTGKTKSLGMNSETMIPLAALIASTFTKNPLLKLPLMLWGGASLFNTVGKESLADYREKNGLSTKPSNSSTDRTSYKQYSDEVLNPRIHDPHLQGNTLILDIDRVPRIVTLPPSLVDAYQHGAIPLNTLANRVLEKSDQMSQNAAEAKIQSQGASRQYEQSQEREQSRGIR